MREAATVVQDSELLGRLSVGNMVAIEAKYHPRFLLDLYRRVQKAQQESTDDNKHKGTASISDVVFAELVLYIEEERQNHESAPVFKLAELSKLCKSQIC